MPRPQKHQCLRAKTLVPAHPMWPQFPKLTCVGTGPRPCDDSGDDATLGHPLLAAERRLSRPSHSDTKASSVTRRRRDLGSRPGHGGGRGYMALHVARYVGISTLVPIVSSVCISLLREYISSVHSEYSNGRGVPPLVRHLGPDSYVGTIDCARLVTKARATCRLRKYDDSGVIQVWSECCRCNYFDQDLPTIMYARVGLSDQPAHTGARQLRNPLCTLRLWRQNCHRLVLLCCRHFLYANLMRASRQLPTWLSHSCGCTWPPHTMQEDASPDADDAEMWS